MTVIENVSEKVKTLLEKYEFNVNTLAKYLGLSVEQINDIANGNLQCVLGKHTIIDTASLKPTFFAI